MFFIPIEKGKGFGYKMNTAGLFNISAASSNEIYVGAQSSFVFGGAAEFNVAGQFAWITGPELKFASGTTYGLQISINGLLTCLKRSVAYGSLKRTTIVDKMHAKNMQKIQDKIKDAKVEEQNINTKLTELEKERENLVFYKNQISADKLEEIQNATKMLSLKHEEIAQKKKWLCDKIVSINQEIKDTCDQQKMVGNNIIGAYDNKSTKGSDDNAAKGTEIMVGNNNNSTEKLGTLL